jgi:hypothetical protein
MSDKELGSNIIFRIIKVLYVLGLIFGFFIVIAIGWDFIPYKNVYYNYQVGSWWTVLLIWILGIPAVYVVLNLLRETLIYIFFGRPFTFLWLAKLLKLISKLI